MRAQAWRVGLFALVGLGVLALAVVLAGGRWFASAERVEMRFDGSVFGLQPGAPVVFRGVRLGQVKSIGLARAAAGATAVPVLAELDHQQLQQLLATTGAGPVDGAKATVAALVTRGLVARLAQQSLLTGLLYVDLDFEPAAATARPMVVASAEPAAIPTRGGRMQALQAQLEGLDLAQIGRDLAAVAASARQLLAGPEPARAIARVADAAQALQSLAARAEASVAPLARSAQGTLAESQRAMKQLGQGAQDLGRAAAQAGAAASQAQLLAAGAAPVLAEVQRAAAEISRAAAALRDVAADDSTTRQQADRALQDVSRAARALREAGEMLERQPDALLRGRATAP